MIEDQIKMQQMTLISNKKKLWKSQLTAGVLLIITLIHVVTYKEM